MITYSCLDLKLIHVNKGPMFFVCLVTMRLIFAAILDHIMYLSLPSSEIVMQMSLWLFRPRQNLFDQSHLSRNRVFSARHHKKKKDNTGLPNSESIVYLYLYGIFGYFCSYLIDKS